MSDDFEKKLLALAGALRRTDPTPAWKADILARARREADAIPMERMLPPRALMVAWAAAWAAIALLSVATPGNVGQSPASDLAASRVARNQESASTSSISTLTLIAFERQYDFNGDLP